MIEENTNIPKHIAIIMDGNGRWAKNKGLSRDQGHKEGKESAKEIVKTCAKLGVKNLTLFAFSTENWKRPKIEVDLLMDLLHNSLISELKELKKNNIRTKLQQHLILKSYNVKAFINFFCCSSFSHYISYKYLL